MNITDLQNIQNIDNHLLRAKSDKKLGTVFSRIGDRKVHGSILKSKNYEVSRSRDALARMFHLQGVCAAVSFDNSKYKVAFNANLDKPAKIKIRKLGECTDAEEYINKLLDYSRSYDLNNSVNKLKNVFDDFVERKMETGIRISNYHKIDLKDIKIQCLDNIISNFKTVISNGFFDYYQDLINSKPNLWKDFVKDLYQLFRCKIDLMKLNHYDILVKIFNKTVSVEYQENKDSIHCELVNPRTSYIGISKLSCTLCYEVLFEDNSGEDPLILGCHGVHYADNWKRPPDLVNPAILTRLSSLLDKMFDQKVEGAYENEVRPPLYCREFSDEDDVQGVKNVSTIYDDFLEYHSSLVSGIENILLKNRE